MGAYCFKCWTKREIKDPQQVTMRNGKPATKGVCPICGITVYRIGKSWRFGAQAQPPTNLHGHLLQDQGKGTLDVFWGRVTEGSNN